MKKILTSFALVLFAIQVYAQQIDTAYVQPSSPTVSDVVYLEILGQHYSSDAYIANIAIQFYGDSINVTLEYEVGMIGLPVLVPYDTLVEIGTLAAGDWRYHITSMLEFQTNIDTFNGTFTVTNPTGIEDVTKETASLSQNYPNPVVDFTSIEFEASEIGDSYISFYNSKGQLVKNISVPSTQIGKNSILVNLGDLSPGLYSYRIGEEVKTLVKK